ncbi:hypothetical protein KVP40.0259 [Vibrio phage KVP40]|uniref:Nicotinate/nicotinamide phosphoribosyltransferase domain-containing protein n=3 Tax=Schizotequatrovirus KVP40 TaxID=1914019 RepID=Q6WHP5_BPKVM|nr:hypothetical protein KVP40.0259 [Vibrio phage KVP40]AAQ64328.1 hypothetical protein KVP40.0259 [Vibrio phage KVP40]QHJ74438.1 hypothetical protein VH12019_00111 [Vibrio phage VH1_2019]QIW91156.1 hypothetical protein COHAPHLL_00320 [Vibrio phage V09]
MNLIEQTADKFEHSYREDVQGVQWYFGSRTHDFYLYGIDSLIDKVKDCDFIEIKHVQEGTLVKRGEAAVTVTITDHSRIAYGNMIETLLYNELWYSSTVGTILHRCLDVLHENGYDARSAYPQIGRASSTPEQSAKARDVFARIFYQSSNEKIPVAMHSDILINGEEYCMEHYNGIMIDTFDKQACIDLINKKDFRGTVMVDSQPIIETIERVLAETKCFVAQAESVTLDEWIEIVRHFKGNKRIFYGIGSFAFSNISRDTFGLIYKVCAVKKNDNWIGVSKMTTGKQTSAGYKVIG